jgi:beta-lactamase regulating signal transducer with metallopeptidase domain
MLQHALVADALRGALVLAATLLLMPLLRRSASSTRRLVLSLGLTAALAVPALSAVLPAWHVEAPGLAAPSRWKMVTEPQGSGGAAAAAPAARVSSPSSVVTAARTVDPFVLAGWAWAIGALFVVARLASSLLRARGMARRAVLARGWESARARVERATGVHIEVRETGELDAPAVCGVLSPVVLVPRAAEDWDEQRRHHVLLHETAHVRRHDCLVQAVAELAVALHWFDPLAWLCARRLRVERELAADDAALEHGARASSYAEDLLAVAGALPSPAGALGMGEPARLAARVRAVLAERRNRAPLGAAKSATIVATSSIAAIALACTAPTESVGRSPASASPAPTVAAAGPGSSIDPALQTIADEELDGTLREWSAPTGVVVVLDPSTGRVLADAGRERGARADVARQHAFVPGSTMKVVVLSAALEAGVVSPSDTIDCEQGQFQYAGKTIEDNNANGVLPLPQAIAVSSNIAIFKVFDRVGGERFGRELRALHFGEAPGAIPVRMEDHSMVGAVAAMGEGVFATPLQVAAAYGAIANGGRYLAPTFSAQASPVAGEPVMKPETAHEVLAMLDEVVNTPHGTGGAARIDGARVAGKTGTSTLEDLPPGAEGMYASFVGIVPEDAPRFVILVGVEQAQDHGEGTSGGNVAAPTFARVATRALAVASR